MPKLSKEQVEEAIAQAIIHCDILTETDYHVVTVRQVLRDLGYGNQLPQLLHEISKGGFEYCLDPEIPCKSGVGMENKEIYPDHDVCYWGPDQISSRLRAVHVQ